MNHPFFSSSSEEHNVSAHVPLANAKGELIQAIDENQPISKIIQLYTKYILLKFDNNKVQACKRLGVDRRTLQRRAKKNG